jgi:four helix bundle protein
MFAHENLDFYKIYMEYASLSADVVERAESWHAFADHLDRASESIGTNAIRGNSQRNPNMRTSLFDVAEGSILECVGCFDVANAKGLLLPEDLSKGRSYLWRIRGMVIGLRAVTPDFVREDSSSYGNPSFPHDRLDIYEIARQIVTWTHVLQSEGSLSTRQRNRLDVSTTGILLNTAEGCGKPGNSDKRKYLEFSYGHSLQSALILDLLCAQGRADGRRVADGKVLLDRMVSMQLSWIEKLESKRSD